MISARPSSVARDTIRRLCCRRFGQGSGNRMKTRPIEAGGRAAMIRRAAPARGGDQRPAAPAAARSRESSGGAPQLVYQVQSLPRETAVGFGSAAEMAVGGSARVDRLIQIEMRADAARRQIDQLLQ